MLATWPSLICWQGIKNVQFLLLSVRNNAWYVYANNGARIADHMWSIDRCHCWWPWVPLKTTWNLSRANNFKCSAGRHVLRDKVRETRHSTCCGMGFQFPAKLHAMNRTFSSAAFISACVTVCNAIRSPCDETWPDVEEIEFSHRLWTVLSNARICSVNRASIHIPKQLYLYQSRLARGVMFSTCFSVHTFMWMQYFKNR